MFFDGRLDGIERNGTNNQDGHKAEVEGQRAEVSIFFTERAYDAMSCA